MSAAERLHAPFPISRHLGFTNLFGFEDHVRFPQGESCDPRGILPPGHLAYLVDATLQGENPARDKSAHDIIGADVGGVVELLHISDDPVGFNMVVLRVESPDSSSGSAREIRRKVNEVGSAGIPDIEKGLLPRPAGL